MFVWELWISPKLVGIICDPMYRLLQVRWRNGCLNTNNITVVLLLCKCHIQIMIRKLTNKGITMLCQQIYNSCTIAISANQQHFPVTNILYHIPIIMNTTMQYFMTTTTNNQFSDQTHKMHLPLTEPKETHLKVF